jgi:hypothetical protein
MLERDARGGTRYIEIIKAQFGVVSPDSRLQRPVLCKRLLKSMTVQLGSTEAGESTLGRSRVSIGGLSNLGNIKTGMTTTEIFRTLQTRIREAIAVQRMLERDARGGTRYIEIIKAQFGVVSPDSRLQRPEYLGGGHSRLDVSQVES